MSNQMHPNASSLVVLVEDIDPAQIGSGFGFLGMGDNKRISLGGDNADPVTVNDRINVPAGTKTAVVRFNYVTIGFGHGTVVEGPFARFAFQVLANTLSGTALTFKVWGYFRNNNNQNA